MKKFSKTIKIKTSNIKEKTAALYFLSGLFDLPISNITLSNLEDQYYLLNYPFVGISGDVITSFVSPNPDDRVFLFTDMKMIRGYKNPFQLPDSKIEFFLFEDRITFAVPVGNLSLNDTNYLKEKLTK